MLRGSSRCGRGSAIAKHIKKIQKDVTAEARESNFLDEAFAEAAAVFAEAMRKLRGSEALPAI